ncbi:macro domain-containing protein [Plantactinospora sp. WMMB334]|uniref:macro domain-containing protein n=1 Tax=Plantactinospora sp. WMMB334 TaxID=3404119 RepID=UPI003B933379
MLPSKDLERFPSASHESAWLAALGPGRLFVKGEQVVLPPRVLRILLRLAVAAGKALPVEQIYRDVWNLPGTPVDRVARNQVQKCVNLLRVAAGGHSESFISTENAVPTASYRLVLPPERIDFLHFEHLVEQARSADAITATTLIDSALGLWHGPPLAEVAELSFARQPIQQLADLRRRAEHDLVTLYRDIGRPESALAVGVACLRERPDDAVLRTILSELEEQLRPRRRGLVHRTIGDSPPVSISVISGDLFAHDDAHLVVGFTDTFDTNTRGNVVISSGSVQAQAMRRLFEGDRDLLDRRLRAALHGVPAAGREKRSAKPRGRLIRYPIGTVAVLHQQDRQVFGLAYSRMGNDLIARSSLDDIRTSLDALWHAVYQEGQLRPLAMPVIGSALARVYGVPPTRLLTLIMESFVACTLDRPVARELRIVLRPADLAHVDLEEVARYLDTLGVSGG